MSDLNICTAENGLQVVKDFLITQFTTRCVANSLVGILKATTEECSVVQARLGRCGSAAP